MHEELKKDFEEKSGLSYEKLLKYVSKPNLINNVKVTEYRIKYFEGSADEDQGIAVALKTTLNLQKVLLYTGAIFITVTFMLTLLFVLFGNVGLSIFTFVISLPFHLAVTGPVCLVAFVIFYIGYFVVQGKLNKEYKRYKKAITTA